MTWYNPSSWFRKEASGEIKFYCANPECREALGSKIVYDSTTKALLHPGECQIIYASHLAFHGREPIVANFTPIKVKRANILARRDKIADISLKLL